MYSQQIESMGENRDLLEFIIRILPIKVVELETDLKKLDAIKHPLLTKGKFLVAISILILVAQICYFFIINIKPFSDLIAIFIFSFASVVIIIVSARISLPFLRGIQDADKKLKQLKSVFHKAKGANLFDLKRRENLIEFIRHRYKVGIGVSLNNIKDELELYGLKVSDADILRSQFDFFYSDDPENRRLILSAFYLDGNIHESFEELSDEEILNFIGTVEDNLKNEPKATRVFLNLYYPDLEDRREILDIYFMDAKVHESFDELSDEQILNFTETARNNLDLWKSKRIS